MLEARTQKHDIVKFSCGNRVAGLGLRDLRYLEADQGRLSFALMEWFTVWFSHLTPSSDFVVCSPQLALSLKAFMKAKDS